MLALLSALRHPRRMGRLALRLVRDTFGLTVIMFGAVAPGFGDRGAGRVHHIRDIRGESPITTATATGTGITKGIGLESNIRGRHIAFLKRIDVGG